MMPPRLALALAALCAALGSGCALVPAENGPKAVVETRRVTDARAGANGRHGGDRPADKPAAGATFGSSRPAEIRPEARESAEAELRRIVERQQRRIAELEARPAPDAETRQVVELIAYAQRLSTMSSEEQNREFAAANQEHAREPGLVSRLRFALALATPGTSFIDDARAASLLESIAAQPARTPLRQLAVLVHSQLSERIREHKRVAQLKEQIEGLRAIDRALIEREPGRSR